MKKNFETDKEGQKKVLVAVLIITLAAIIVGLILALFMAFGGGISTGGTNAEKSRNDGKPVPLRATVAIADTVVPTPTMPPQPTITPTVQPTPTVQFGQAVVIGYSVNGLPIEVYQFGSGLRQRMIVAGIHGGYEWNTVVLAEELIAYLMENPDIVPPEVTLFILPDLNPDGYGRARDASGRANVNGVDLNRNFDAAWLSDWNRDMCWHYEYVTAGPEPGSEPETQAFMGFVESHDLEALLNYHSAGLGIFPGGDPPGPKSQLLAYYISMRSPYAYPPKDIGCVYSGQLVSWMVLQGVPAVDIELSTHGYTDFEINKGILEYFLRPDLELDGS